ncbi:hypothetical protein AC630_13205 [Bradyrhizobium sp. AS23.2]|nr:hypothetical protein AC630_13205 [Bradyrhizobium sp. AS23.2]
MPAYRIAEILNERDVPTVRGGKWQANTVARKWPASGSRDKPPGGIVLDVNTRPTERGPGGRLSSAAIVKRKSLGIAACSVKLMLQR